jgi:TfoX/Sxy family transcriptional regulator of competence genes
MPYSESLAERIRHRLAQHTKIVEKKMFGGIGFLLRGNMLVGVWKQSLGVRLGPQVYADALREPFVGPFDITGRAMRGWVLVAPQGLDSDAELRGWIERAIEFVATLPPK